MYLVRREQFVGPWVWLTSLRAAAWCAVWLTRGGAKESTMSSKASTGQTWKNSKPEGLQVSGVG